MRFVGTDTLIIFWKFHIDSLQTISTALSQMFLKVGSLNVTWRPDLRWPGAEIFTKGAEKMNEVVLMQTGGAVRHRLPAICENRRERERERNASPPHTHPPNRAKVYVGDSMGASPLAFLRLIAIRLNITDELSSNFQNYLSFRSWDCPYSRGGAL